MAISVIIVNPSSISLNAGDVVLALIYKGVNLGTVTMPNLNIVPGANTVATYLDHRSRQARLRVSSC